MVAEVSPPEPATRPPWFVDADTLGRSSLRALTSRSPFDVSVAVPAMSIVLSAETASFALALPMLIAPPPSFDETALLRTQPCVVTFSVPAVRLAPPPTFVEIVSAAVAFEVAVATLIRPPPAPDADAETISSPAVAPPVAPPIPISCCVPDPGETSSTNVCGPLPDVVRSRPSRWKRCGEPTRPPLSIPMWPQPPPEQVARRNSAGERSTT